MVRVAPYLIWLVAFLSAQQVYAEDCGHPYDSRGGGGGPFDYRDPRNGFEIQRVTKAHFTPYQEEVALYGRGWTDTGRREDRQEGRSLIAGNLDYTLRAIPNHPRALYAMAIWQLNLQENSMLDYQTKRSSWGFMSAECYFERAIMFVPDDADVYQTYGLFLYRKGDLLAALGKYKEAVKLAPDNASAHYNIGLLYLATSEFEAARKHSDKADELGYHLDYLRDELDRLGH